MARKARADKVLILGCDGFDPRYAKRCMDAGLMPNLKKYVDCGACREDLVMLGGHPTVTPSMWTTLATGAYANVHGITDYYRKGSDIDVIDYNFDSRNCKAEQLWNVTAEAGLKTLVWHWPGSAWPPSSLNENLYVVDGTSPGSVNMSNAQVEQTFIAAASVDAEETTYKIGAGADASTACVMTDVKVVDEFGQAPFQWDEQGSGEIRKIIMRSDQNAQNFSENKVDYSISTLKPAKGWDNAPEGSMEFVILFCKGMSRRICLLLKNDQGIYDRVAIYKNKKSAEPIVVFDQIGKMMANVRDTAIKNDQSYDVIRNMKLLELDPDGKNVSIFIAGAMDVNNDTVWHPKRLYEEVVNNIGCPPPTTSVGCQSDRLITDCMLDNWEITADWQAASLNWLIDNEGFDVIFSHYHAIDLEVHMISKWLSPCIEGRKNPIEMAHKWMDNVYAQTDRYLGKFLHYLDEGWTVIVTSDHGLVGSRYKQPVLDDLNGVAAGVLADLGYTVLEKDEEGNPLPKIDWTKTRAVMQREGDIYINLKGREKHTLEDGTVVDGIVDPADKYELEEQLMTDLYGYKDPQTGHRIVALALRNKDSVLLGLGGPECGDVLTWNAEGYNFDHGDSLSTTYGEGDTSVSPLFIAAGKGIKEGFKTERIIREVDVVPTVAVLTGVRMPRQCEGAPVYQIFDQEF